MGVFCSGPGLCIACCWCHTMSFNVHICGSTRSGFMQCAVPAADEAMLPRHIGCAFLRGGATDIFHQGLWKCVSLRENRARQGQLIQLRCSCIKHHGSLYFLSFPFSWRGSLCLLRPLLGMCPIGWKLQCKTECCRFYGRAHVFLKPTSGPEGSTPFVFITDWLILHIQKTEQRALDHHIAPMHAPALISLKHFIG